MKEKRFELVMGLVDAWAEESALLDMRWVALDEVEFLLSDSESSDLSDEEIADVAIKSWMMAE